MTKKIVLIVLLLATLTVRAQFELPTMGARGSAMGGCSAALDDFWSGIRNIASTAQLQENTIGASYRQNYLMEGFGYKTVAAAIPTQHTGTWIGQYTHFGNLDYNEQQLAAGYAVRISKQLFFGGMLHFLHSSTSDAHYEPTNLITFGLGLRYHASKKLCFAIHTFNPIMVQINADNNVRVPLTMNIGIAYQATSLLLTTVEIEKNIFYKPTFRFGIEYNLLEALAIRTGASTAPGTYTFGVAYKHNKGTVDLAFQAHSVLGITPQISTTFQF